MMRKVFRFLGGGLSLGGLAFGSALLLQAVFSLFVSSGPDVQWVPSAHAQLLSQDESIADIAERTTPSVVNIFTSRVRRGGRSPFHGDPLFRFFEPRGRGRGSSRMERSLGSGVIVSADGYIITNNHVVGNADEIKVSLHDGREFQAKVVGTDPPSDVAVIKIDATGLPPIAIGDSSAMRVGEVVLAIGNPFGVGQTVTMGIISAVGRADTGIVEYEDFIQTDAAINPGNSGGALINMKGELIGVNTAIASRSGGYQGIGFAIPSQMAIAVKDSLLRHGRVVRGWLGVAIQNVTPDLAEALSLTPGQGVLVGDVSKGSPAEKAGVKREDVVLSVDGVETNDMSRLRTLIATKGAGAEVRLRVLRAGKPLEVIVTLGELGGRSGGGRLTLHGKELGVVSGLELSALTDSLRKKYELPGELQGVIVMNVERDTPAAWSGLREGDVVLALNRREVSSPAELKKQYERAGRSVVLLVYRGGYTIFLTLRK